MTGGNRSEFLLGLLEKMIEIREFEEGVKFLFLEGAMPGTIHQCQGQEATAVGVCSALAARRLHHFDFSRPWSRARQGPVDAGNARRTLRRQERLLRGQGRLDAYGQYGKGMVPGIAIVGGGIPLAAGMALSFKLENKPQIVACFFGDGAVAEGAFHEGVNMAAIWDLPVDLCLRKQSLRRVDTHRSGDEEHQDLRPSGGHMVFEGETVDGNDVLAVHEATKRAAAQCRAGKGPYLLELLTYRRTGHSRRDPCHYQPKDERKDWFARDPIDRFAEQLQRDGLIDPDGVKRDPRRGDEAFRSGCRKRQTRRPTDFGRPRDRHFCDEGNGMKRQGIAEALARRDRRGDAAGQARFLHRRGHRCPRRLGWRLHGHDRARRKVPGRVLNTPIAELGFFGVAVGAAMMGSRPIADVQYGDFLFLASDQIINNAAKLRYMSGGKVSVPMVMRAPVGATGRGFAACAEHGALFHRRTWPEGRRSVERL